MLNKLYISVCICLCTFQVLISQDSELAPTQQLSISDGLAHNGVTSILEDSKGFLWVGTFDGLNKYDGYEFEVFKNTVDKKLLASNRVREISEDKKGNLWIGTDEGITLYDYSQKKFKTIYANKSVENGTKSLIIRRILINKKGDLILCGTEKNGILVFDDTYNFIGQYVLPSPYDNQKVICYDGLELDEKHFLFSTSHGLWVFNSQNKSFQRVLENEVKFGNSITEMGDNHALVTMTAGIAVIQFEKKEGAYEFLFKSTYLESHNFVCASIDTLGNVWLGEQSKGVFHLEDVNALKNNTPIQHTAFLVERGLLRVGYIAAATNSGCWVGTFNEGLYRFKVEENPFKYYNTEMDLPDGLYSNEVMSVSPLDKHRVLISAHRGGISIFNTQSHTFEPLPFVNPSYPEIQGARAFVDGQKNIWLKSPGREFVQRLRPGSTQLEPANDGQQKSLTSIMPRVITEDKDGNIWIGGNNGVHRINLDERSEIEGIDVLYDHPFFKTNKPGLVRTIYIDTLFDYVWVGTNASGLMRLNMKGKSDLREAEVDQYIHDKKDKYSLSSNFVSTIVRLPNGELWVGTERGGICKVEHSDKEPIFHTFSEKQGLSNNVVKNILFDDENNLWISTNIGLNKFNPQELSVRRFSKEDGLPFENFSYASAKLENGYFLFSGLDGFCYFNPKELPGEEILPKLALGELKIFNKSIQPGDSLNGRILLERRLSEIDELTLKHNENVVSLELNSLHYSNPDYHFLKYRLLPLNENWIEVSSDQRYIYFNGLQPGKYVLQAQASNSLHQWTQPLELTINIKPPFWKTWQAYILYAVGLILILYVVFIVIFRIQSLNHNLEIEKLEKENVKEINDAKLRFFSNISHEIKTPLTLISGPIDLLSRRFKDNLDIREKLQSVQKQSLKISRLIDQVLDFQRSDANELKMNYSGFSFTHFINDLIPDYELLAIKENKQLEISKEEPIVYVSADKDKLEKIINNLLSNAFKYSQAEDAIGISYTAKGKDLIIEIKDTGMGIDQEDLPHVFERFYQSHKKLDAFTSGSGIGLAFSKRLVEMHLGDIHVDSQLAVGTNFTVRLPIVQENLSDDQQQREQEILKLEQNYDAQGETFEEDEYAKLKVDKAFADAHIFLAEDNQDMRTFVSSVLSNYFKVKAFENGQKCLDALQSEWPDLVLSDVLMPELNGFELCKSIKSDFKTSHIPVILLTACTTIDDQIEGIKQGADGYIQKPFNTQHLISSIETLLRSRKQLRERYKMDLPLSLDNNQDNAFIEKLYSLMEENLDNQELDLNSFAKELYLNRTHFYQKVKALTNQTPFELLKMYRLKKAAEFLVQENLSVNEVFWRTGFKSRTHFSKLFKERYEVTPGKYASEAKKKFMEV